jgi:hypothetical protein
MDNLQQSIKVKPAYKWIQIIDYKIERDVYGLKGWVRFNTERDERINEISSIHLDQNQRFKKLFRWS